MPVNDDVQLGKNVKIFHQFPHAELCAFQANAVMFMENRSRRIEYDCNRDRDKKW